MNTPCQANRPLKLVAFLSCAYFVVILLLLFIGQIFFGFYYDHQRSPDNLVLLPFVAALVLLLIALAVRLDSTDETPGARTVGKLRVAQAIFLLIQFAWVYMTWFVPVSESLECYNGAYALATGVPIPNEAFFRVYPHNAPNALLTSYVIRLALFVGVEPRVLFPYVGAVILNLTTYLINLIVYRLTKKPVILWISFSVASVWIGLSQFLMVPYSDVYGVLFPVLAIWILTGRARWPFKWFFFSLFCFFGYAVRPTALIPWIAYLLLRLLSFKRPAHSAELKRLAKKGALVVLICLLAFVPAKLWKDTAVTALAGEKSPSEALTMPHYIMMGMNYDTLGEFSKGDYDFSCSFATVAERENANAKVILQRITSLPLRQTVKFALIKLYKPHADGNFFADCCYNEYQPPREDPLSPILRDFYLKEGKTHVYNAAIQQIIWLTVLCFGCYAVFSAKEQPAISYVLCLSVLGITAYNMIGENWTRYLFVFTPLYFTLAMLGLSRLSTDIREKRARTGGHACSGETA